MTLTSTSSAEVASRAKCNNELSKVCDGLVAVYEFEEGLNNVPFRTLPDRGVRPDGRAPKAIVLGATSPKRGNRVSGHCVLR